MARKIGIMQGRLSPPIGDAIQAFPLSTWRNEFAAARQAGLDSIEWIFDREDSANPIASSSGIAEILALNAASGVKINSLCADYFMSEPLLQGSAAEQAARAEKLAWLLAQCAAAGIRHVVLPFVDRSKIETPAEQEQLVHLLHYLSPAAANHRVELHLETSLPPRPFAALLEAIDRPFVKINYDTGNSASLGYNVTEEFEAYGRFIGSIHIKDRVKGGTTVPLDHGQADFPAFGRLVEQIDYRGDFILQVARGRPGDEISWAKQNVNFLHKLFQMESSSWISA